MRVPHDSAATGIAVGVLGLIAALALVLPYTVMPASISTTPALSRIEVAGGALAVLGGVAAAVRSRVDGYAPAWWVGLALLAAGIPSLVGDTAREQSRALHVAAALVALACALRAAHSPEVDTTISPVGAVVSTVIAGGALLAAAQVLPVPAGTYRLAHGGIALAYALLASTVVFHGHAHRGAAWPGLVPVLTGLGCAALVTALAPAAHGAAPLGAALVLLFTFAFAAMQIVGDLRAAGSLQRRAAFESELLRRQAERDRRRVEERFAETLHEVRSTVCALEGGVRGLDGTRIGDAPRRRAPLASALGAEIERLRTLVSEHEPAAGTRYRVDGALTPMLTVSAAGGWPVQWAIPQDVEVSGRPADLAQVVHGLLVNATRHAAGSPIDVSVRRDHEFVLVCVDDRGPGVDRGLRDAIFERGVQGAGSAPDGAHGLGLYIARSMMRRAGGDVWVEPRLGGGSRFVVAVPTADPAALAVGELAVS